LMAPDTPCGTSNHQGMMFRFHALTITSTLCANVPETVTPSEISDATA